MNLKKALGYSFGALVLICGIYLYDSPRIQEIVKGRIISTNSNGIEIEDSAGVSRFLPIPNKFEEGEIVEILIYETPLTKQVSYSWFEVSLAV
ncbi:hypothetical protein [Alteromonas macleodii]|uniref:hypothetical protein n=1 Tax=Alteromonas macleodii TaxID=28108 RepID=UPI002AB2B195|nr:hypothetical protein [Alteromonas macleodii]MEC9429177.1 hypothetical protein [Pseudomonadota bacterium]